VAWRACYPWSERFWLVSGHRNCLLHVRKAQREIMLATLKSKLQFKELRKENTIQKMKFLCFKTFITVYNIIDTMSIFYICFSSVKWRLSWIFLSVRMEVSAKTRRRKHPSHASAVGRQVKMLYKKWITDILSGKVFASKSTACQCCYRNSIY